MLNRIFGFLGLFFGTMFGAYLDEILNESKYGQKTKKEISSSLWADKIFSPKPDEDDLTPNES